MVSRFTVGIINKIDYSYSSALAEYIAFGTLLVIFILEGINFKQDSHRFVKFVQNLLMYEKCRKYSNPRNSVVFYLNGHEPIHVHAKKGELESKAAFYLVDGTVTEIRISEVKGVKPLKGKELKDFKVFLELYSTEIIEKWINYFVYHKEVSFERITKRLR